jgi:hypothetical protein
MATSWPIKFYTAAKPGGKRNFGGIQKTYLPFSTTDILSAF